MECIKFKTEVIATVKENRVKYHSDPEISVLRENKLFEQRGRLVTKLLVVLSLHLIGWEDSRSFPNQLPSVIECFSIECCETPQKS